MKTSSAGSGMVRAAGRLTAVFLGLNFVTVLSFATGLSFSTALPAADPPSATGSSAAPTAAANASGERVLLLKSGRIMTGRIKLIASGYLVSSPNGHVLIPFEHVSFDADNITEAYERMRQETKSLTPASHLKLADWCLSQNLYEEAAVELRAALHMDPSNETARVTLARVDQELRRREPDHEPPARQESTLTIVQTGAMRSGTDDEIRSLAGLDPETAKQFMGVAQPILINRCGNARCHGSSSGNAFQLSHVRSASGNPRLTAEKNLARVLRYIDSNNPEKSPLLAIGQTPHGGQAAFHGRAGAAQLEGLRHWVTVAAGQIEGGSTTAPQAPPKSAALPQRGLASQPDRSASSKLAASTDSPNAQPDLPHPADPKRVPSGKTVPKPGETRAGETQADETQPDEALTDETPTDSDPNGPVPGGVSFGTANQGSTRRPPATRPGQLTSFQEFLEDTEPEALQPLRKRDAFDPDEFNRRYGSSRSAKSDRRPN